MLASRVAGYVIAVLDITHFDTFDKWMCEKFCLITDFGHNSLQFKTLSTTNGQRWRPPALGECNNSELCLYLRAARPSGRC
jgi:hypothetical protein